MRKLTYILMPLAFISMIVGVTGGYTRMGVAFPLLANQAVAQHGILMVGCFFGALISIERVIAVKHFWAWGIPIFMTAAFPALLLGFTTTAYTLLTVGSVGYFVLMLSIWQTYKFKGNALMLLGAMFQVIGNSTLLVTNSYPTALAGWILFLLLTITGERLEMTRFIPVKISDFLLMYFLLFVVFVGIATYHLGYPWVVGIGACGVATWFFFHDIALKNIQKKAGYKFLGTALLSAYFWLFIFGFLALLNVKNPYQYDAFVHTFFIGFALNMIIAHAPIILPSILGIHVKPFHPTFYIWLILFQLSIAMRILGDVSQFIEIRKIGGLLNGLVFLGYLLNVAIIVFTSKPTFAHVKNN